MMSVSVRIRFHCMHQLLSIGMVATISFYNQLKKSCERTKVMLINRRMDIVQEFTFALQILGHGDNVLVGQMVNGRQDGKIDQHSFNEEEKDDKGTHGRE